MRILPDVVRLTDGRECRCDVIYGRHEVIYDVHEMIYARLRQYKTLKKWYTHA